MARAATQDTIVLITGANKGIGLAFAKLYAARPQHRVFGTARNVDEAKELSKVCSVVELDVGSDESCAKLPSALPSDVTKINILINNAGVLKPDDLEKDDLLAGVTLQMNTNALGPLRVTRALLPYLKKAAEAKELAKIVNVTSRMGSIADNTSGRYYGYRASKAALNQISVTMARDLAKLNIGVVCVHPGMVKTSMTDGNGDIEADEAAKRMVKIVDNSVMEDGYKFFHRDGQTLPW